jgi:ATP-dependent Clp protease ATP-binding subunit ClpB
MLEKRLAAVEMKLQVTDAVLTELAKVGFDPLFGARPLKRAIQSTLENPLAKEILEGRFGPKDTIVVDYGGARFSFTRVQPAEAKVA